MTDRDFKLVLDSIERRLQEGFNSIKELISNIENNNKEKMADLKARTDNHAKRIGKLEISTGKLAIKVAGISALIGSGLSLLVKILAG